MTFVGGHEHASTPPREAASSPERGAHSPMDAARKTSSPAVGSFGASARIGRAAPAGPRSGRWPSGPFPPTASRDKSLPAARACSTFVPSSQPRGQPCPLPSRHPSSPESARARRQARRVGAATALGRFFCAGSAARKSLKSPTSHGRFPRKSKCPKSAFPPSGAEAHGAAAEGGGQSQSARLGADQRKDRRSEPALRDPPPSTPARRGGEGDDDRIGRDARPENFAQGLET